MVMSVDFSTFRADCSVVSIRVKSVGAFVKSYLVCPKQITSKASFLEIAILSNPYSYTIAIADATSETFEQSKIFRLSIKAFRFGSLKTSASKFLVLL